MIRLLILLVFLLIPTSLLLLNLKYANIEGRYLFSIFVIIMMFERIRETFYKQKSKNVRKFQGDWTLIATIFSYFVIILLMICSFYLTPNKNLYLIILGIVIFFSGVILRIYSVKLLGGQWNIHISKYASNLFKRKLIIAGPYKYIRHPIYVGAILELIGFGLIANSYLLIIVVIFLNIPLFIWRAIHEEKQSMKIFGKEYTQYKHKVSFMIPWKILTKR